MPRLRASRRRGRRGEQCPSVSLRTGTRVQPCLSGNAAADTDPARGAGQSRGGGRVGGGGGWSRADWGAWDSGPRRVTVPGRPGPPGQQATRTPARARARALSSPDLFTRAFPPPPPPPTQARAGPFPLSLAEIPLEFLGRTFTAKGSERHKDAEREGGSERGRYYWPRPPVRGPWALPSLTPSGSRWFKVILRAPHPTTTPRAAADPETAASNHTHTQRASPKPWSWHSRPSTACSGQLLSFVSCLLLPSRLSCCALHLLSLMPETSLCWALPSAGRGASAKVDPSVLTSSVQQIFIQTAWDHAQVRDCRHAACPLSLRSLSIKCNHETV